MGVDVGEGGHGRTIEKTVFLAKLSQSPRWTTVGRQYCWARANHKAEILTAAEFSAIETGLKEAEKGLVAGTFKTIPGVDETFTLPTSGGWVAIDLRLWLRDELRKVESYLVDFLKGSHWMLSYAMAFAQGLERLPEVIVRVNQTGNCFGVDREAMTKELGFDRLVVASTLTIHISRWAEDLIIYSAGEFTFVKLADAYFTESSLMPQKKNPDSLEPLRGKSGRVVQIAAGVLSALALDPEKMKASFDSCWPLILVTNLPPFIEAHHIIGQCFAYLEKTGTPMSEIAYSDFKKIDSRFVEDVLTCFDCEHSVDVHSASGGTAKVSVLA
ncbi:argininosuccinate lyase-like protein [Hyaloscypha finlandica]|nr:argininosuccinate lyase-like protein [Hyaloscypha finlandica]